jgi:hypothetical protein
MSRPRAYLTLGDVVARYGGAYSKYTLYEATRTGSIPHRKLPGRRELLFIEQELDAFDDGAELEVVHRRDGGRVVRPVGWGR